MQVDEDIKDDVSSQTAKALKWQNKTFTTSGRVYTGTKDHDTKEIAEGLYQAFASDRRNLLKVLGYAECISREGKWDFSEYQWHMQVPVCI